MPSSEHRSSQLFERAVCVLPGGTSRATIERDPIPRYMDRGEGAYLIDVDGRRFLDLNGNFTALIHGHAFAPVVQAVTDQLKNGSCFANPTLCEVRLAELLCERLPAVDMVRFVNSGTEAVMFAIKAARAYTGRSAIAKIEGAYHGAYDWAEISQGCSPDNWGAADSPSSVSGYRGAPPAVAASTLVLRFNQTDLARRLIRQHAGDLAAVVLDPMPGRVGLIPPDASFVEAIQEVCREHEILLIADEVLNLRQGYHGASARIGLKPDLVIMGKIIGGGLPIGAVGGRSDVMAVFSNQAGQAALPQSGTFSANPLSMVAGLAAMRALDPEAFGRLDRLGERVRSGLRTVIARERAPFSVTGAASLFRIHPHHAEPAEYRDAFLTRGEAAVMRNLTRYFAANGVLLPFASTASISTPMGEAECDSIVELFSGFVSRHRPMIDDMEAD